MTEMDEVICRSFERRVSPPEAARLIAWRQASPQNEAHYQTLRDLLQNVEPALLGEPVPAPPPVMQVVARGDRRETASLARRSHRQRWMWRVGTAVAALAATVLLMVLGPFSEPEFSFGKGEFVTGEAETATVVLADGTVVRLAPQSRLRIPGVPGSREVFLEGQAFFAVAKMPGVPFRVLTQAGEARVLGTQFEIRTQDENLRLVVLEGRVALETTGEEVQVGAGEMSFVSQGTTSVPVKVENVKPLVPWLERFLVFQGTPLREVALALEREYGQRVEVTDSALAALTVTGWYADRSFEDVVQIVCGVLHAECAIQDGVARILPMRDAPRKTPFQYRGDYKLLTTEEE